MTEEGRDRPADPRRGPAPPRSAYLHIPFCHRRCFYCDFAVVPLGDRADAEGGPGSASIAHYLALLHREIAQAPPGPPLSTVYVGGGTPSMLSAAQLADLLAALRRRYGLAPGAEITLEMDPASFDRQRLAATLAAGITRVSLGGQSFDDDVLERLGRRHRRAELLASAEWLEQARRGGDLISWSLDLIQGVPLPPGSGEPLRWWRRQLEQAIALKPPHLSIYDLIVEPGTVFERLQRRGELPLPDEDTSADLMDQTQAQLCAAGYGHYEVSNYALPGHASRHNRVYWSGAGWWGFGLGATSAPWGVRQARPRTREAYAAWLEERAPLAAAGGSSQRGAGDAADPAGPGWSLVTSGEPSSQKAESPGHGPGTPPCPGVMPFDERVLVGLRRREGVPMASMLHEAGLGPAALADLRLQLEGFEQRGLLRIEGPRWRLSDPAGLALSNAVLRELLLWWERAGR
ncbi:MAG: radical SAM family heme chaperone HemW [Cyanobium sp.]